jgi:hypothetical protein
MGGKTDEGDFGSIDLFLGIAKAAQKTEEAKSKTQAQLLVEQIDSFVGILTEIDAGKDKSKFVHKYYVPYFAEMKKRNLVEPFTYYAFQSSGIAGVEQWLAANDARVQEFLIWSNQYAWPQDAVK